MNTITETPPIVCPDFDTVTVIGCAHEYLLPALAEWVSALTPKAPRVLPHKFWARENGDGVDILTCVTQSFMEIACVVSVKMHGRAMQFKIVGGTGTRIKSFHDFVYEKGVEFSEHVEVGSGILRHETLRAALQDSHDPVYVGNTAIDMDVKVLRAATHPGINVMIVGIKKMCARGRTSRYVIAYRPGILYSNMMSLLAKKQFNVWYRIFKENAELKGVGTDMLWTWSLRRNFAVCLYLPNDEFGNPCGYVRIGISYRVLRTRTVSTKTYLDLEIRSPNPNVEPHVVTRSQECFYVTP